MTWECKNCKNEVDEGFDICWSCGATFDGHANPHFCQEIEATKLATNGERTIECDRCGFRGKSVQIRAVNGWLSGFFNLFIGLGGLTNLTNHACPKCGETRKIFDWK